MKPSPLNSCASVNDLNKEKSIKLIFINHEGTESVKKIKLSEEINFSHHTLYPGTQTNKISFGRVFHAAANKNRDFVNVDSLHLSLLQRLMWFSLSEEVKNRFN